MNLLNYLRMETRIICYLCIAKRSDIFISPNFHILAAVLDNITLPVSIWNFFNHTTHKVIIRLETVA